MSMESARLKLKYLHGSIAKSLRGEKMLCRKLADFEMVLMLERGDWLNALLYVLLSVVLCIGATIVTMALVKMILV